MQGQSKYAFSLGTVTITKTDDGYAPNDAELQQVRVVMEQMLDGGRPHLTFDVDTMHVQVEIDERRVMAEAVKPLRENRRIHR